MGNLEKGDYIISECVVCGKDTSFACSDCSINSGGKDRVHVCPTRDCQQKHEEKARCTPLH